MTARTSRNVGSDEIAGAFLAPLNFVADLPRKQLALMTQSAAALSRASETIRKVQQQAAHRASTQHQEAAERLRSPCDFSELLAIQSELMRFNMQEAAQYWQQMASAVLKIPMDLAGTAGESLESGPEPTLESLQKAFAASMAGGAPETATTH
jgi:hypothetical protein